MLSRGQPLPVAQLSLPQGPQGPSPQATVPSGQGGLLGPTQRGPCQPFLSWSTKEPGTPPPQAHTPQDEMRAPRVAATKSNTDKLSPISGRRY